MGTIAHPSAAVKHNFSFSTKFTFSRYFLTVVDAFSKHRDGAMRHDTGTRHHCKIIRCGFRARDRGAVPTAGRCPRNTPPHKPKWPLSAAGARATTKPPTSTTKAAPSRGGPVASVPRKQSHGGAVDRTDKHRPPNPRARIKSVAQRATPYSPLGGRVEVEREHPFSSVGPQGHARQDFRWGGLAACTQLPTGAQNKCFGHNARPTQGQVPKTPCFVSCPR